MNVTAAARVPAHVARPSITTGEATPTDEVDGAGEAPRAKGGSDTPFTHAINMGNGKKVGIHRRMPTAEDITAEQLAAGLDPTGSDEPSADPVDGATPVDGAAEVPADVPEEPVTDAPIAIDGSDLGLSSDTSVVDDLVDAVAEAVADASDPLELLVPDDEATSA